MPKDAVRPRRRVAGIVRNLGDKRHTLVNYTLEYLESYLNYHYQYIDGFLSRILFYFLAARSMATEADEGDIGASATFSVSEERLFWMYVPALCKPL